MTEWYPWYPALYEADTLHLTAAQDGIYRRLIDWYMAKRRPLPDNDQALAAIARIGLDEWLAAADVVRPFFQAKGGKLHHKRCNIELDRQDRMQKTRSEVAKKGGEARAQKLRDNNDVSADSTPEANSELAESTSPARRKQTRSKPEEGAQLASAPATGQDRTREERKESRQQPSSLEPARGEPSAAGAAADPDKVFRETGTKVLDLIGDPGLLNYARVRKWLDEGADPELDILPAVKGALARQRMRQPDWRPRSLNYFDGAVAEWLTARTKPLTGAKPNGSTPTDDEPWTGVYRGRKTPLYEGHAAIKEHVHLLAWLQHRIWPPGWDDTWERGREPRDDDEARTRLAALEPVIWPDSGTAGTGPVSGGPKAEPVKEA